MADADKAVALIRVVLVVGGLLVGGTGLNGLLTEDRAGAGAEVVVPVSGAKPEAEAPTSTATSKPGSTSTSTSTRPIAECANVPFGFLLRYPAGWHTKARDESERCRFFHPEPFDIAVDAEVADVAITIERLDVTYDEWLATYERPDVMITERMELTVAGGARATRLVVSFSGEPPGTLHDTYLVDTGVAVLAFEADSNASADFDDTQRVLAAMVRSLGLFG